MNVIEGHLRTLLLAFPPDKRAEVARGLHQLRAPLNQLAWEVVRAEEDNLPFAQAAGQESNYPLLAKCHHGLLDLLQLGVPLNQIEVLRAARRAPGVDPRGFRSGLFRIAAVHGGPEGALARFACYQAIRLNVWIATWDDPGPLEASGTMRRIDIIAERILRRELRTAIRPGDCPKPLRVLVAQTLIEAERRFAAFREDMLQATADTIRAWEQRAQQYQVARSLAAPEAVLLRHALDASFGHDTPGDVRLAERHPLAFPSKDALHQRRKRMREAYEEHGRLPAPRETRFVDFLRAETEGQVAL